jgi:single-strand DNA-binding protein
MNTIILKGRLTRDPEVRYTQSNSMVTQITIAVDRYAKAGEEKTADFIDCVAFTSTAEFISKYFKKGQEILVNGRLQIDSYTDKEGNTRRKTNVVISQVEFCGSKAETPIDVTKEISDGDDLPF